MLQVSRVQINRDNLLFTEIRQRQTCRIVRCNIFDFLNRDNNVGATDLGGLGPDADLVGLIETKLQPYKQNRCRQR